MAIPVDVLIVILLIIFGVALFILLFIAIMRFNEILKQVKELLTKNEKNIDQALDYMPKILHNVNEITEGIHHEMKHIQGAVKNIEETIGHAASTAQVLNEDIILPLKEVLEILGLLKGIFFREKKKGWLSK